MGFYDPLLSSRREVTIAGKTFFVVAPPVLKRYGFFGNLFFGLKSLWDGMKVTFATFIRPSRVVTQQYPENRATLKMYDRFRAKLQLVHDEHGHHQCTACRSCEKACPNGSITIETAKGEVTGKNEVQHFIWRFDSCAMCNLCVFSCPFEALAMSGNFENAVYDKRLLVYNLNRYQGPHAGLLAKIEDPAQRAAAVRPLPPFSGPVPLLGHTLPGFDAVVGMPKQEGAR